MSVLLLSVSNENHIWETGKANQCLKSPNNRFHSLMQKKQVCSNIISKIVIANTNIFTVNTVNSRNLIHISRKGNYKLF